MKHISSQIINYIVLTKEKGSTNNICSSNSIIIKYDDMINGTINYLKGGKHSLKRHLISI